MLVIVKRIMSGRDLGGLDAGTQRHFEYAYGISYHIGAVHQVKNEKYSCQKITCLLLYRKKCVGLLLVETYMVRLNTRTHRRMRWTSVGRSVSDILKNENTLQL